MAGKRQATQGLSQEELARRQMQRERRELALKLRAEGKEYRRKAKKHKPRHRVQLIVIPIYWAKKNVEANLVLQAAEKAVQMLRDAGVKADIDSTTEKTPGQKMRAWEEKGVKLRVEIGPKEATAGQCIFAKVTTPGQVADKQTVHAGPQLCDLVRQQLEALGQVLVPVRAQQAIAATAQGTQPAAAVDQQQAAKQQGQQATKQQGPQAAEQQVSQAAEQQQEAEQQPKSAENVAGLPEPTVGKKGKKKAAATATKAAEVQEFLALEGEGAKPKKKKIKVVQF